MTDTERGDWGSEEKGGIGVLSCGTAYYFATRSGQCLLRRSGCEGWKLCYGGWKLATKYKSQGVFGFILRRIGSK